MDFPPLEDTRWDRLLGAVIAQRPTVGDAGWPLATSFPPLPSDAEADAETDQGHDEPETWRHTIERDAYA